MRIKNKEIGFPIKDLGNLGSPSSQNKFWSKSKEIVFHPILQNSRSMTPKNSLKYLYKIKQSDAGTNFHK